MTLANQGLTTTAIESIVRDSFPHAQNMCVCEIDQNAETISRLEKLKYQFDPESDEYADVSQTIHDLEKKQ